jgi:hypothetical protein
MYIEQIEAMPQDIINNIGAFYITKQMKLLCRLSKINHKVKELEKRTIDEWIEHVTFSKRYNIKIIKLDNENIEYTNSFGDKYTIHKTTILNQGYIAHVRKLYLWYIQRIISSSTPLPQYEGEIFVNVVGEKMIARMIEYGENDTGYEDECNYAIRC